MAISTPISRSREFPDLAKYFLGFARVHLRHLSGEFRKRNVSKLLKILNIYSRLDPDLFMTVLINRDTLKQAAERSGIDIDNGLGSTDPPVLSLEHTTVLPCLRGRDLLEAVRCALSPGQKWWITKLYCAGKINNFILYFLYILNVLIDWTLDLPIYVRSHLIEQFSIAQMLIFSGTCQKIYRRYFDKNRTE